MRSVPEDTRDVEVAINILDLTFLGQGTSTNDVSPFERFCSICFNILISILN